MADTKFSQFSNAVTLTGAEKLVGLQSGNNVQMQLSTLFLPYINSNTQLSSTSQVTGLDSSLSSKLNLSGSNSPMTGLFSLSGDPVSNLQPTTKQYVDNFLSTKLNLSGGTMTGSLTLNADPITNLEAATKQYVDSLIVSGEYLKVVNNLSDVNNVFISAQNIGASNAYTYVSSSTVLTSPLPRRIGINVTSSGQTIQLPNATTLNSNVVGDIFFIDNYSIYSISILDGTGSPLITINAGTKYFYSADDNFTVAGIWNFWPWIGTVNGSPTYYSLVDLNSAYSQTSGQNFTISSGLNLLGGNLNIGTSSPDASALLKMSSVSQGFLPPVMTKSQFTSISSPVTGLLGYMSDYNSYGYFNGSSFDTILSANNIIAGSNFTIVNNGNGTYTYSASGGSSPPTSSYASFSTSNNSVVTSIPVTATFYPIYLGTSFSGNDESDFTNQFFTIGSVSTPVMTYNGLTTQFFNVNINLSCRGAVPVQSSYNFSIFIRLSNGTIVPTQYRNTLTLGDLINYYDVSITGNIQLNTGDSIFVEVQNITNNNNFYVAYSTFSVISLAGSIPNTNGLSQGTNNIYLSQNGGSTYQYLSGSSVVGNLAEFNSTGSQLIDSGIPASSLFTWKVVTTTTQQMSINTGYIVKSTVPVIFTLPSTGSTIGSMEIVGTGSAQWQIIQNTGQSIEYNGLNTTTTTGSVYSGTQNDSARIVYSGDNSGIFNIELSNGMQLTLS